LERLPDRADSLSSTAIDALAQEVRVAGVAGVLLDHVDADPVVVEEAFAAWQPRAAGWLLAAWRAG